jgi:hypothetical protein
MKSKRKIEFSSGYKPPRFEFSFESKVQVYEGPADWYFAHLPIELSKELNELFADQKRGFGSLRVEATLNGLVWETSIFPDGNTFMLPLKLKVRQQAGIELGDKVRVSILIKV